MQGRIQDKMLACKKRLVAGDYRVSVVPVGNRKNYRFPEVRYSTNDREYTTYYLLPCFDGLPLSFMIQVEDESDKPVGGFKYMWKLFYIDRGEAKPVQGAEGEEYLTLYEDQISRNELTLASEHVLSCGQYSLQIQLYKRGENILHWYAIANFSIVKWDFFLGVLIGLMISIITVVVEVILAILKH